MERPDVDPGHLGISSRKRPSAQQGRAGLRYGSDLSDEEWAVLEPLLPAPARTGRPPSRPMREIVAAIFYVLLGQSCALP